MEFAGCDDFSCRFPKVTLPEHDPRAGTGDEFRRALERAWERSRLAGADIAFLPPSGVQLTNELAPALAGKTACAYHLAMVISFTFVERGRGLRNDYARATPFAKALVRELGGRGRWAADGEHWVAGGLAAATHGAEYHQQYWAEAGKKGPPKRRGRIRLSERLDRG